MSKKAASNKVSTPKLQDDQESKIINIRMSRQSKRIYLRTRKTTMWVVGTLFVIPWMILLLVYLGVLGNSKGSERDPAIPAYQCKPGPWGALDCYDFITDPPDDFLTDELFPPADAVWYFGPISRDALHTLFDSAGMPKDARDALLQRTEFSSEKGWIAHPTDEFIFGLTPGARKFIYRELAKLPENPRQVDPFIFDPIKFDAWLAKAKIPEPILANIRKLLYPHGEWVLLADTVTLMKTIPERDDRRRLLEVLLRRATSMLKLRIPENTDVHELAHYWGAGGRENEVLPMLESLSQNRGGMRVDVSILMPPFVRTNLYRYPSRSTNPAALHRDCHWTAFNFYNEIPDDKFIDPVKIKDELLTNYEYVKSADPDQAAKDPTPGVLGPVRLGDIALLITPDDKSVHSCVYIADDLYFTKNGPSHTSPWVLMKQKDVLALFPAYEDLTIRHYRKKEKPKPAVK